LKKKKCGWLSINYVKESKGLKSKHPFHFILS